MFEKIEHNGQLMAFIIYSQYSNEGVTFFTDKKCPQQLGFMKHKKGKQIEAHYHNRIYRQIDTTMETLFIRKGKMRVDFYTDTECFDSKILNSGDVIMLYGYGHGFEMIEDTEFYEIKQGPYDPETDKTLLKFEYNKRQDSPL